MEQEGKVFTRLASGRLSQVAAILDVVSILPSTSCWLTKLLKKLLLHEIGHKEKPVYRICVCLVQSIVNLLLSLEDQLADTKDAQQVEAISDQKGSAP